MSPVDFKNDDVPCRYFSNVPVDFKVVQCCLSNFRKRRVTLSNLKVKGPHRSTEGGRKKLPSFIRGDAKSFTLS